ncbi:hypothetical protein N665_0418s0014 [Sinapis alba]|nr:hypothetical protein N665_0418s0014 [Sinapis alba]
MSPDAVCKRWYQDNETEVHIFFECPYAKMIWRASGISNVIINSPTATLEEKLDECITCRISTSLRLWKSRNLLLFQHNFVPWQILLHQSFIDAKEWYDTTRQSVSTTGASTIYPDGYRVKSWSRPPENWMKINVDGGFLNSTEQSRAGWVITDHNGVYIDGVKKAVDILNGRILHFDAHNWKREMQWWKNRFTELKFQRIDRRGNKVAEILVKHQLEANVSFKFHYFVHRFLTSAFHNDFVLSTYQ